MEFAEVRIEIIFQQHRLMVCVKKELLQRYLGIRVLERGLGIVMNQHVMQ
jgi:hypothetical protein